MKYNILCILSLGILPIICACSPATIDKFKADGKQPLSAEELHQEISNQRLNLEAVDFEANIHYLAGGKLSAKSLQGEVDTGTWNVSPQDQLCMKFRRWYYGDLNCYTVFKDGERFTFFTSNGARYYSGVSVGQKVNYTGISAITDDHRSETLVSKETQLTPLDTALKKRFLYKLATDCPGCNFSNASLAGASLANAQLAGANLSDANLAGADLSEANLAGADLSGADLTNCNLSGANLSESNLLYTTLTGAVFIGADLTGVQIESNAIIKTTR